MASLTPKSRQEEVTDAAWNEGMANGGLILLPSMGGLYMAMQNARFRKLTNWQSRTAIVIMPALFAFALTSEHKMYHRMTEVAEETEHAIKSVEWADNQIRRNTRRMKDQYGNDNDVVHKKKKEEQRQLYRQSVLNSGVRVVEGTELSTYERTANFIHANPFKVIASIGIPAVGFVFYGQGGQETLQMRLLHTRVLGQASVLCTLLGIMALKDMMDRRYVSVMLRFLLFGSLVFSFSHLTCAV